MSPTGGSSGKAAASGLPPLRHAGLQSAGMGPGAGAGSGNGGLLLLLSLFLLLLVFFIVLNAQTMQAPQRVRAVMASLDRSFPSFIIDPRLRDGADPLASRAGTVFAAERLAAVGDLFAASIAVAKTEIVGPGHRLEVRLPADELFVPGTAALRPDRQGLIDRVAEALRDPRPGERLELDALLALGPAGGPSGGPAHPPGPVARAGALARLLVETGAPAEGVTIGIERGEPGAVRLLFSPRDAEARP
ncbi:hypothetical protein [Azospirillum sp. SYSU D00513]|uniref:hypothetical protein n=1 Tax=Azospirillum sp. SYSU D00513 TaxID=2812561 RepID=UPI001FFF461F|nr:hypothetical protein [Azospirillum sp. SYSU D00513]